VLQESLTGFADLRCDFGQPDGCFNGLDLAEEGANAAELVMPPVLEKPRGFGRDVPIVRIGDHPPLVHFLADGVDDRRMAVLLVLVG
jgi:hypothetical protein